MLEMLTVLFLLTVVVVVVLPRISLDEDLSSTGRKLVGVLRTFQGLAATSQQHVKLYFDLDQGTYWMMMVEGKEERDRHPRRILKKRAAGFPAAPFDVQEITSY